MKRVIRLNESDLKNIVRKSVGKILREFGSDGPDWDEPYVYNDLDPYGVPSYKDHVQSASDFDTDDDLLGLDDEDFDDEDYELSNIKEFESRKRLGKIIRESINKVLNETEVYPGWDSTTTGDYGTQEEPSYMKPQGHESEEDERRRHEKFLRKIYADYGLPNGLGKGNSDDVIVGNNELASKTDLVRAFARYFRNRFKDAPEGFRAYEILFKNYVKDPAKIYKWFEKNGIDYKKYLGDADDSRVVRMKY